jgi:hypothetical protein
LRLREKGVNLISERHIVSQYVTTVRQFCASNAMLAAGAGLN